MSHDQDAGGLADRDTHPLLHAPTQGPTQGPTHGPTSRGRKPVRPPLAARLERPSLFAGMEEDEVDDLNADRVGLLSTLAARGRERSKAGRTGAPRKLRSRGRGELWASPWWGRALFTLMALGAIAVLYSFVQVVQQPHAMSARARAASQPTGASDAAQAALAAAHDLHALEAPAAGADTATAQSLTAPPTSAGMSPDASFQDVAATASARIEVITPPAPGPRATATAMAPTDASPPAAEVSPPARQAAPTQAALVARAAADAARLNAPSAALSQPSTRSAAAKETTARSRGNDDVALLEAMMKHASARRAPPSSMEALQTCAALQGADAAVCRAKACVQHPTAPQCHGDTP